MAKRDDKFTAVRDDYFKSVGRTGNETFDPTVNARVLDFSHSFSKMQLCFISDMHIGSVDFDMDGLVKNLKYAASQENALVFFLGDGINAAIVGSKSDPYEDVLNPQQQLDLYTKIVTLSKGNSEVPRYITRLLESNQIFIPDYASDCLDKNKQSNLATMVSGNHESRISKAVGISPVKIVAEAAGAEEAFSPFFSNTEILLRVDHDYHSNKENAEATETAENNTSAVSYKIVGHHGTGNSKIDDMVNKYLKQVNNADLYVMGHVHDHVMTTKRVEEYSDGKRTYRDVMFMSLPASGGGTYAAGMSMPRRHKQTAVWMEVEPQPNPMADCISSTGVYFPKYIVAPSFFNPNTDNIFSKASKQDKSVRQAHKAIEKIAGGKMLEVLETLHNSLTSITDLNREVVEAVVENISVKPLKEPKGFLEYMNEKIEKEESENAEKVNRFIFEKEKYSSLAPKDQQYSLEETQLTIFDGESIDAQNELELDIDQNKEM